MCLLCRMVRMYQTACKGMAWHPPICINPIPDTSSESNMESDLVFDVENSSDDEIDYIPVRPEIEVPIEGGDGEIYIIEPPPIPVVDLVTESEEEKDKVEEENEPGESKEPEIEDDLEEGFDERANVDSMDTSGDTSGEITVLAEFDDISLSFEELRLRAKERGKRVRFGEQRSTPVKRTCFTRSPSRPSPDRSTVDEGGYEGDTERELTKRVRGFWDERP
jgi:hypothetical protein